MKLININELYEHPKNPRQNVGDVTELADSIKANGVFQNLTVIEDGPGVPEGKTGYTVIIGHRRLAASKEAGLTELPCSVVEMDEREQISTMLLENMQRSDLTNYEQAQGFQMMLDLGETQQSISALTGFSEATVCRRLKLLSFDKKKFLAAEERGGTLEDYIKAAEIKNDKDRQKVLDAIGTHNFSWELRSAINKQKIKENLPLVKKELRSIATEDKKLDYYSSKYERVASLSVASYEEGCFSKLVKKGKEYFWVISNDWVYLCTKASKEKKQDQKKSKKEIAANETRKQFKELTKQTYEMRREFIDNFFSSKKCADVLNEWMWEIQRYIACSGNGITKNYKYFCEMIGAEYSKYQYRVDKELTEKFFKEQPSNAPAVFIYFLTGDNDENSYVVTTYGEEMPSHYKNERLDMIYKYLCKLGYQMSDTELQLQNGTHELFKGEK